MIAFLIACGLSAVTFLVHSFVGSKEVMRPLLDGPQDTSAKYTLLLAWHGTTILLGAMTLAFALAAFVPSALDLGALATGMALCFAIWGLALQVTAPVRFSELPQWVAFVLIGAAGLYGCVEGFGGMS